MLGLEVSQAEKDTALPKCLSSQRSWAANKPRLTITAVSDADNVPIFDPGGVAHRLRQHGGGILGARSTDIPDDQAQVKTSSAQPVPRNLTWSIDLHEIFKLIASMRESAPGPDGLPYSVYSCAGCLGAKFLQIAALPWEFGANRPVFIPKTGEVNAQGLLIRSPESLRPATLGNCDCKILTAA